MDKFLYLRRYRGPCSGEEVGILEAELLAYDAEEQFVVECILGFQVYRRPAPVAQVFDIVAAPYVEGFLEEHLLCLAGIVDFRLHAHIHLLPESWHGTHARGMSLTQRLLYLLGISIDDEASALCETEDSPSPFEDMSIGKEVHDDVVFRHRHTPMVGFKGSMILSVGKYHTLAVACGSTGIEDVADVVVRCFCVEFLHLRLPGVVLAEFQEVIKIYGVGVAGHHPHARVEDNDSFESGARRQYPMCLVVLFLLAHEKDSYFRIVYHEAYLLLAAGGIEGHGNGPDAKGTEVGVEILHGILREYPDVLLHLHSQVEQGVRHLFHYC